jgi:transcription factor TGA
MMTVCTWLSSREALHAHLPDGDLRSIIDDALTHYGELFHFKGVVARTYVFHLITGMWATPAEGYFLSMGSFQPSNLLKACVPNYTEHYLCHIYKKCKQ